MNYLGREFISIDGYKCSIIKDMECDKKIRPSKRKYKIRFEDGTEIEHLYSSLRDRKFKKPKKYIGEKFTNKNGDTCVIIDIVGHRENRKKSLRYYKVKFDDGTIDIIHYPELKNGTFKKRTQEEIDRFKYFKCKECGLEIYFNKELRIVHMIDWHGK